MRWAFGIGLTAFALPGCRQVIGIDVRAGQEGPGSSGAGGAEGGVSSAGACGFSSSSGACGECVRANCCSESSACAADPPCAGYYECLGACMLGDWACRSQCGVDSPPGDSPTLAPLSACAVAHCESECRLTCGAIGPTVAAPDVAAQCQACLTTNDCPGVRTCASSVDCASWWQCWSSGDFFCSSDGGRSSSLMPIAPPIQQDLDGTCSAQCGRGSNWSCLGHVHTPASVQGDVTLTFGTAEDYATSKPLEAVNVSACRFQDPNCNAPLAMAQTDASGKASLHLSLAPGPSAQLDANSYLQAVRDGYATTLQFWGGVVTKPQVATGISLPLLTTAEAQAILSPLGFAWDTTRGVLGYYAMDCSRPVSFAHGVQVTIDVSDTAIHEFYGPNFDFNATQTDSTGLGGFINVPPGAVTVTATPVGLGKPSSRRTVLVRPGTWTLFYLSPANP